MHACSVVSDSLWTHGMQPSRLLSMGFSRQEYWSELPFPSSGVYVNLFLKCILRRYAQGTEKFSSVQSSHSVMSDSLPPHEKQHARPPCPSPTPGVHSDSRSSSQWCHPAISSSVVPFSSCPQSLPASKSFPMSQLFAWGGQSTGVSALASFLPKKSQVDLLQNTYFSKAGKSHQYILWGILPKVFISVGNKM